MLSLSLRWLGEPILDAGLAACLLDRGKSEPGDITLEEWQEWLEKVEADYLQGIWSRVLSVAFTQNSPATNPSYKPAEREKAIRDLFTLAKGSSQGTLSAQCVFYPELPAITQVARDTLPMVTGRGIMNFTPNGGGYIPVSFQALGCLLGSIYTTPLISGRLLACSTADGTSPLPLLETLHRKYVQPFLSLARAGGRMDIKYPLSRLGEALEAVAQAHPDRSLAFTALWYSNSGQDPDIVLYRYVPAVYAFLRQAQTGRYRGVWNHFVRSFWVGVAKKKRVAFPPQAEGDSSHEGGEVENRFLQNGKSAQEKILPEQARNLFYEELPYLPERAAQVVRLFFKGYALRRLKPLLRYGRLSAEELFLTRQTHYQPIWDLLTLFLKHFLPTMTEKQIQLIRDVAKRIAYMVVHRIEPRAAEDLLGIGKVRVSRYSDWRAFLIRLLRKYLDKEGKLLFTLEDYLSLFEQAEGYPVGDWTLARDLLQIAVLEELYQLGYFKEDQELLRKLAEEPAADETEIL